MSILKAIAITVAMIVAEEAARSLAKEVFATEKDDD